MTKTFLLLILTLMTGYKASPKELGVRGCSGGWVDFTCTYPKPERSYHAVDLILGHKVIKSNLKNDWVNEERVSLYHNVTGKSLRVIIRGLQQEENGLNECRFHRQKNSVKQEQNVNLTLDKELCQEPFSQTAHRTAETNITCEYPDHEDDSDVKFFCKEIGPFCEDILSTGSSVRSNETFTLTETERGFSVSISNMSSQHKGVYWCGLKSDRGDYRAGVRKINLIVENVSQSPVIIPVVVCAAVLLLLLLLVLLYKRFGRSKQTTNEEAENPKEDQAYEEIQERPQNPDPGSALRTVYATANLPTIPSAPQEYSNSSFTNSSGDINGDTYSTVRDTDQSLSYLTLHQTSGPSEDPLFSTLSSPQQQ